CWVWYYPSVSFDKAQCPTTKNQTNSNQTKTAYKSGFVDDGLPNTLGGLLGLLLRAIFFERIGK
ncbi:hypothetical protein, partial [Faucicola atlantae]|uniref:hypothetical protein n=1 Tax=Faucicola atlantae TaxID=34059 RepID=UPI001C12A3F3